MQPPPWAATPLPTPRLKVCPFSLPSPLRTTVRSFPPPNLRPLGASKPRPSTHTLSKAFPSPSSAARATVSRGRGQPCARTQRKSESKYPSPLCFPQPRLNLQEPDVQHGYQHDGDNPGCEQRRLDRVD